MIAPYIKHKETTVNNTSFHSPVGVRLARAKREATRANFILLRQFFLRQQAWRLR